jgi:hypothetical protein
MKTFLITLLLLCSLFSFGQNCDCKKEFSALVSKIESDYAGFHDKVNKQTADDYKTFTAQLSPQSAVLNRLLNEIP